MGYKTLMTRNEDKMLYDMYGDNYDGRKKTYDLKNRLKFAELCYIILKEYYKIFYISEDYHGSLPYLCREERGVRR